MNTNINKISYTRPIVGSILALSLVLSVLVATYAGAAPLSWQPAGVVSG